MIGVMVSTYILLLRSSNPRRPRKTRAENRSNHSLAPSNFCQKASCVSQKRHPSSHLVLLRPGHPMSTPHHVHHILSTTEEYLARHIHTPSKVAELYLVLVAEHVEVTTKQIGEEAESKIWVAGLLTRLLWTCTRLS
jgi:hypothetical protein